MLRNALLTKRCDCPGANDANVLWMKGNVIATTDCNPCYYGLFVLVTGLCGGFVEPWPTDAIPIATGFYAIPNRGDEWSGDLAAGFSAIQPGTGALLRFYPVGVYRTLSQVQYVVTTWQSTLAAFRTGASTRLCLFTSHYGGTGRLVHCPGNSGFWPAGGGVAPFNEYGMDEEIDLGLSSGHSAGTHPDENSPGCFATFDWYIELYHEDGDAAGFFVGSWDDGEGEPDQDDARHVELQQDGENTWTASGTITVGPCKDFGIRCWNWTQSSFPGSIDVNWTRTDCPDVSPEAEAAWQQVLDDMYDIPTSSEELCELQAAASLSAEMEE